MPSLFISASAAALPARLTSTGDGGRVISKHESSSSLPAAGATSSSSDDSTIVFAVDATASDLAAGLFPEDWPEEAVATAGVVKLMLILSIVPEDGPDEAVATAGAVKSTSILSIVALARVGTRRTCMAGRGRPCGLEIGPTRIPKIKSGARIPIFGMETAVEVGVDPGHSMQGSTDADGADKPATPAVALLNSALSVARGSGRFSRAGVGSMRSLTSMYSSSDNTTSNNIRTLAPDQLSLRYRVVQTLASGTSTVQVVRHQDDARLLVLKVVGHASWPSRRSRFE